MASKRHKYDHELDDLWVSVDELDMGQKTNIVEAIHGFFYFDMNPKTGAIRSFQIKSYKSLFDSKVKNKQIYPNKDDNSLLFSFLPKRHKQVGADCVYMDHKSMAMITLDRNEVGNLQGIEIINPLYFTK